MSKSPHETESKGIEMDVVSLATLVDWDSLLFLIANELDACTRELRNDRQVILKVRDNYRPGSPKEKPSFEELRNIAIAIGKVVRRFEQIRPKAFREIARAAMRDVEEAEFVDLE